MEGGGAVGIFSELLVGLNDSFKSVCNRVDLFSAPGEYSFRVTLSRSFQSRVCI